MIITYKSEHDGHAQDGPLHHAVTVSIGTLVAGYHDKGYASGHDPRVNLVQPHSTTLVLLGFTSSVGLRNFNQRPNSLFSRRQLDNSTAAWGSESRACEFKFQTLQS